MKRAGRTISEIGEAALIKSHAERNEFASAHDLQRSFANRWAKRVLPPVLQKMMRHTKIETTMKYYAEQDTDELAQQMWDSVEKMRTPMRTKGFEELETL